MLLNSDGEKVRNKEKERKGTKGKERKGKERNKIPGCLITQYVISTNCTKHSEFFANITKC